MLSAALASQAGTEIAELNLMTCRPHTAMLTAAALALLVAACASGGNRPAASMHAGVTPVVLTLAQNKVVEDGVRQMAANPGAQLKAVTATRIAEQPGIHVCGYVATKGANGKEGTDLPFYVELREAEGKPVAERGQVGSNPSKLSKIKFVCRRNG
jgi:hypothetical protein